MKREGDQELIILLFCNAATINAEMIDKGISVLREKPDVDSVVSVSKYNMWSPLRARKIGKDGLLHPFVPFVTEEIYQLLPLSEKKKLLMIENWPTQ